MDSEKLISRSLYESSAKYLYVERKVPMKASKNKKCATNCATIDITRTNVAIKCLTFRWSDIAKIGEVRFSYAPQKGSF